MARARRTMDVKNQKRGLRGLLDAAILSGIFLAGGCNELPASDVRRIKQAHQAYRLARYSESDRLTTAVIRDYSDKPDTAEAYYLRGISRLKQARRLEAEPDLHAALRLCRRRTLEVLLYMQLGNLAFQDGAYRRAAKLYRRAMDDLPSKVAVHEVWYRYGVSLQRSGDFAGARAALRRAMVGRVSSTMRKDAVRKISWKHDYFTVQCGAFSQMRSARAVAETLRRQGIDAVAPRQNEAGSLSYVVHAGRYRDYASARAALPAVRRVQADAFIVP